MGRVACGDLRPLVGLDQLRRELARGVIFHGLVRDSLPFVLLCDAAHAVGIAFMITSRVSCLAELCG